MSDKKTMSEQRANLIAEARKIMDASETLDAEQRTSVDAMLNDADELRKDIERVEAIDAEERAMKNASDRVVELEAPKAVEAREELTTGSGEYRKAFDKYVRFGRGRLSNENYRALEVGTNSEGGYLAPVVGSDSASLQATVIQTMDDASAIMGLATVVNVSGEITIPTQSSLGAAGWSAEEASVTENDDAFGQVSLTPYRATRLVKVSEELLADSAIDLESYLGKAFGRSFANLLEDSFMTGSGSGQPTGVENTATSALTAASATAITADELIQLFYAVKANYRNAGTWVFNSTTAKEIHQLKDSNNQYLWQPALSGGQPDMLLGRPVAISDSADDTATGATPIFFGDWSYYWVAMRQGVNLKRLDELYAANSQVGLLGSIRVDGELTQAEAVQMITMA